MSLFPPKPILHIPVSIDAEMLANSIRKSELIEFVKTLDCQIKDWGFTLALYEYFKEEYAEWEKEQERVKREGVK